MSTHLPESFRPQSHPLQRQLTCCSCFPCSDYSKQLNDQRIKVLMAREDSLQDVLVQARLKLRDVSKNQGLYKRLMTDFLVQVGRGFSSNGPQLLARLRAGAPGPWGTPRNEASGEALIVRTCGTRVLLCIFYTQLQLC